jgi:hypothetical protein
MRPRPDLPPLPPLPPSKPLPSPPSYGYDPLGLGKDPETVAKYRANELLHARWAMLATAGAIIPEGLAANGADIKGGTWWETGSKMLNGGTLNWSVAPFGVISNPLPLFAVVAVNVALMAAAEGYRAKGEGPAGYSPGIGKFDSSVFAGVDPLYPGGPFDPLVRARGARQGWGTVCARAALMQDARSLGLPTHADARPPASRSPLPLRAWLTTPRCSRSCR